MVVWFTVEKQTSDIPTVMPARENPVNPKELAVTEED